MNIATDIRRIVNTSLCVLCSCVADAQIITTKAGTGTPGFSGDGGPATAAQLQVVSGLATDATGNLYIGDQLNRRLRRVAPSGAITTICGTGIAGFSGDGGPAATATIGNIRGVATDAAGNIYMAIDGFYGERIRKINSSGIISTIAGTGISGFSGDGGPATDATVYSPGGVAVDPSGNIYFADVHNYRIRRISAAGIITTVAGNGAPGYSGDGGPATAASLFVVNDICLGPAGDIYFTDASDRIRRVSTSGVISTIAGTGIGGYSGDGGPATSADITVSTGICADGAGNIFFTDGSHRVRRISTTGIIATIAGTGVSGFSGDGCAATFGQISGPWSIAVSLTGSVYFGDNNNHRVRGVTANAIPAFTHGSVQTIEVCNAAPTSISTYLEINDANIGQAINWSVLAPPAHGTLAATFGGLTTGGNIMPSGATYTTSAGYFGADTFRVVVSDCGNGADTTTVCVTVTDPTISYPVAGDESICVGYTTTLSVPSSTGTWSSSDIGVATVSSSGVVTAISTGTVNISYDVVNACGPSSSFITITVFPAADCPVLIGPITASSHGLIVARQGDKITVRAEAAFDEALTCTICDMAGRTIASKNTRTNNTLEFPELRAGCVTVLCAGRRTRFARLSCPTE